jgi:hypothetical protein
VSGKQIKLFLVDGAAGGLTTAEITNWTGHVLSARRSDLAELLRREEAQRTGVYLLLGDDESALGETRCYIGEADVVADRLRHHLREKEFWDRVIVITSKDTNLTKSHGRYLESRLIFLATEAKRVTLENGTAPPVPSLPEADSSDMDYFLAQLQIVLPVLGVNAIRVKPARTVTCVRVREAFGIGNTQPRFGAPDRTGGWLWCPIQGWAGGVGGGCRRARSTRSTSGC